jgi:predicted nucleotidyltransferase
MDQTTVAADMEQLTQQLMNKYDPLKIILFGSAVNDIHNAHDIDLLIVKDNVPAVGTERIRQLYRIIDTNLPVDYLVYRPQEIENRIRLGDPFICGIVRNGKVLYG